MTRRIVRPRRDLLERRARAIEAMQVALRARAARQRRRAWLGRFAIAASVLLGAIGAERAWTLSHRSTLAIAPASGPQEIVATGRNLEGSAKAFHEGRPVPFDGAQLASGDRVVASADGHAEIALSTGTSGVLAPSADVTFARQERVQTFAVANGGVRARVAKLHEGERFLVRAADVEVEVRGTVFEVSLAAPDPSCGDGTPTRVRVSEGVVVVRHAGAEARVAAGEQWPTGCTGPKPATTATVAAITSSPPPSAKPAPSAKPSATTSGTIALAPEDGLAQKNDLFSTALAAKRRGDVRAALAGFDAYLAHYPGGELAENASAQRMSILAKLDAARGTAAARDYLAHWPNGFAREEARTLSGETSPASSTP
jgi:hypothetical protein